MHALGCTCPMVCPNPQPRRLRAQAAGAMERSEVVSDAAKQHQQRTSSGAWLSGPRRTDTVG